VNSPRAVETGVYVVRGFVKLRELLAANKKLAPGLDELEARIEKKLTTHDQAIAAILSAIRQLMNPPTPARRPMAAPPISTNNAAFSAGERAVGGQPAQRQMLAEDVTDQ
jgi:hypothetical protein